MTNIYEQAYCIRRKPNKDKACDIIKELWQALPERREELASLFKYFVPADIAKPKTALEWLSRAVSKDPTRHYIANIYREDGMAVATDGNILLAAPCEGAAGYISSTGELMRVEGTFPDWKRLIPKELPAFNVSALKINKNGHYQNGDSEIGFNKKLLDVVLSFGGDYIAYWDGSFSPLYFSFLDGRLALIMPLRRC